MTTVGILFLVVIAVIVAASLDRRPAPKNATEIAERLSGLVPGGSLNFGDYRVVAAVGYDRPVVFQVYATETWQGDDEDSFPITEHRPITAQPHKTAKGCARFLAGKLGLPRS